MSTLLSPSLLIASFVLAETEAPSIAATGTLTISASVVLSPSRTQLRANLWLQAMLIST